MRTVKVLAVDLGGSSGRVMLGEKRNGMVDIREIHRFSNDPVMIKGTLYWDILRILYEIKVGILKSKSYGRVESIAIDTWGVDFGLLDVDGYLMDNPVHYRDARTRGLLEKAETIMDRNELYSKTGNQIMEINSLFQLLALQKYRPSVLERAHKLLTIPALLSYFLGAKPVIEASMASTTQLFDQETKQWAWEIINRFNIPSGLFPEIVESGSVIGELSSELCEELQVEPMKIVAGCSHDTQSAQLAIPSPEGNYLFISCGTWSLIGTELDKPILTEQAMLSDLTNESAYGGKISFMKNVIGLWLIQESRRQWKKAGIDCSYGELEKLASKETDFCSVVDPDDPVFLSPGDIPTRIREYCMRTKQAVPNNIGQVVKCINESLAVKYRKVKDEIEQCTKTSYDRIYIVGGGSQSAMLCQLTADRCGVPVIAGPAEATVYGNIAAQLKVAGIFEDISEVRKTISDLDEICIFEPREL